jgi:hypothetical protein
MRDTVVVSYSHRDVRWLEELKIVLAPLVRVHGLPFWDDTAIPPGARWRDEITHALSRAKVAVLLVSPYFLASEFIQNNELPPLLDAAESDMTIIWICVSDCMYAETAIVNYQAAHDISRPLDQLNIARRRKVLTHVGRVVKEAMNLATSESDNCANTQR